MENGFGIFHVFWSIFWLFLMIAWFWVLISVVADIFRSKDLSGVAKALWVAFVILLPWLGVLAYIIVRGGKMEQHRLDFQKEMETAQKEYIRSVANVSAADEIERLAKLKDNGHLSEEEFQAQKAKVLGT
ncbi:SHOCT domain-containing protein [Chachezhania sediminis]|uniref:SHOCT domain-containing protein n=1 Tax=Chachezhania sediminis TaxID=2599291 RepID=UPI00131BA8B0|nr:SHOCT domain-containing protein [Chachezhania sediminis]